MTVKIFNLWLIEQLMKTQILKRNLMWLKNPQEYLDLQGMDQLEHSQLQISRKENYSQNTIKDRAIPRLLVEEVIVREAIAHIIRKLNLMLLAQLSKQDRARKTYMKLLYHQ